MMRSEVKGTADTDFGRWRWAFAVTLALGVLWLIFAAGWGAYRGYQDRIAYRRARATIHYQLGMEYLEAGRLDLARKELESALVLQPNHAAAIAALKQLQEMSPSALATPAATPQPTPEPTAAATAPERALDATFEEAAAAYQAGNWEETIRLLESIRLSDATYRREEVEQMLFDAYVAYARSLVDKDRFEEALRMFDRALTLRPDAQEVKEERDLAKLYVDGLSYWRADWEQALARFQELYDKAPDYRDARQRLIAAHVNYADWLGNRGDWCAAVKQYDAALAFVDTADVRASRDQAEERCRLGIGVLPEGAAEEMGGRLALAAYDPIVRHYRIFTLVPGEAPQTLLEEGTQPAWSPDGRLVAFRSLKPDELGIEILDTTTGERRRATYFVEDGFPSWSPDGQQLVFASNREGDRRWRIYRMWAGDPNSVVSLGYGQSPAWSPDGQRIAYQGCDETGNRCGLWSMAFDGTDRRPLTQVPSDTAPAWSPDGRRLAFMSYDRSGRWALYMLDIESGQVSPLVTGEQSAGLPVWSPNGAQIAFMQEQSGTWGIYVLSIDSGEIYKLIDLPGTTDDWLAERLSWGP